MRNLDKKRKIISFIVNMMLNHNFFFRMLGFANKHFKIIQVVYCGYPATEKYLEAYNYGGADQSIKYHFYPFLAGFYIQNKKIGLKFFISASENDFENQEADKNLSLFLSRMNEIKNLVVAKEMSFAGILPGVLLKKRLRREYSERDKVVNCVIKAIDAVLEKEDLSINTPIIVLGAKGYIGREVVKQLSGREVYKVDLHFNSKLSEGWPIEITGRPSLLVNISRNHAIEQYQQKLWKSLVILNEVYPEPTKEEADVLAHHCAGVYHLAGVNGQAFPHFPEGYQGSIPCSAAWASEDIDIALKKLS